MPFYNCKVIDELGAKKSVVREATDKVSLRAFLKRENLTLLKAKMIVEKEPNVFFSVRSKVKAEEVVVFLRQFAVMINASIAIVDALAALKAQKFSKAFQKVILGVYNDVLSGKLLSEAFGRHPKVFPHFFVQMVAIGEVSGSLDSVLKNMADYYERDRKIRKKAKSAMIYPMLLLSMIVIVIIFMSVVILPQFGAMFDDFGGEIPQITRVILSIASFIRENLMFILIGLVVFILLLVLFFKTKTGKRCKEWFMLHLPILKTVTKNLITARFTRAFIILLESGMNITDCMENLVRIIDNSVLARKFRFAIDEVKRGKRVAKSIESTGIFPSQLTEMIDVGEKSGNLTEVLEATSEYFDTQVETSIHKATTMIEPLIIILLGGVVAVVLLSVYLPMIDLMNQI